MDINYSLEELINGKMFLIDKPVNWTSFDVVKKIKSIIKKKYNIKKIKVGHAGTLDPLATGLLIVCVGKLTKNISAIQMQKKTYKGELTLGSTTPSYDLETEINASFPTSHITKDKALANAKKFLGETEQIPPIFSALKKDGERLYKKARRGEKVDIASRLIKIDKFDLVKFDLPKIEFEIICSKGTYIRSVVHDFGKRLHSGAYLSSLSRTRIGDYKLTNAIEISSIKN